jgi:uncharacterized protein (DUF427 family)
LERTERHIEVVFAGVVIANTRAALRVLETSHPPAYYLPLRDMARQYLVDNPRRSYCEWKGQARYVDVKVGDQVAESAGWFYPDPTPGFSDIKDHFALYPEKMEQCTIDGETVRPQPGGFYGGWVTSEIVGPFKGEPGTEFW